jgi:hypothetical protein
MDEKNEFEATFERGLFTERHPWTLRGWLRGLCRRYLGY